MYKNARSLAIVFSSVLLCGVCGCQGRESSLAAATRAFKAPADYAVVSSDTEHGLVTLRSFKDGELRVIDVRSLSTVWPASPVDPAASPTEATGTRASNTTPSPAEATSSVATQATSVAAPTPSRLSPTYSVASDDADGRTLVHGPGIHIERAQGPARNALVAPSDVKKMHNVMLDHGVICGSNEHLRLTNVTVTTPSAGLVLQSGCHLELVDSEIRSNDVGVIVNTNASLDLENSVVRGRTASIQAAPATEVRSWASTFIGPTSIGDAHYVDRGGNVWE